MRREQTKPLSPHRRPVVRRRALIVGSLAAGLALGVCSASASAQGCPNEEQRLQQGSTYLAQCRGFELASPALKNEEEVLVQEVHGPQVPFQAAREGGGIAFMTLGALPESSSGGIYDQYIARSSTPGSAWSALSLQPESQFLESYTREGSTGETEYFSPDLSCGIEQTELPLPEHSGESKPQLPAGETAAERITNLYVWHAGAGSGGTPTLASTKLISDEKPANAGASERGTTYSVNGATEGCKRIIFESEYQFLGAPAGSLYEWVEGPAGGKGTLRVASVLGERENAQHEKEPVPARFVEGTQMGEKQSDLGELTSEVTKSGEEVSRVVFTAIAEAGPNQGHNEVFLRETRTTPGTSGTETAVTIEVSASQGPKPVDTGARFQGASIPPAYKQGDPTESKEGQEILFTANYGLTSQTSTGPESCDQSLGQMGPGCDLYAYNVRSHTLTDLSADDVEHTGDTKGAGVVSVLGIAEEAREHGFEEEPLVYFSASGHLGEDGNTQAYNELTLKNEAEVAELVIRKIEAECSSFTEPEERSKCEEAGKAEPKFKEEVRAEHEAQQSKCAELAVVAEQERCAGVLARDEAKLREANVYAYREAANHTVELSYVATIGQREAGTGANQGEELDAVSGPGGMHYTASRVSADGAYLLFATHLKVREADGEEYENVNQITNERDYEYYEYSLASDGVTCVSCAPERAERPIQRRLHGSSGAFQTNENGYLRRNLSENGTVFFDSVNPLVGRATNKTVNVYQWQPEELGGCEPVAGHPGVGSVCLLDSGSDPNASYFADASANGENVYITTQQQLAPEDQDGLRDVYDVRAGGGMLSAPLARCSEEGCQTPYRGLGSTGYASESGVGGGNPPLSTSPPGPPGKGGVKAFTAHSVSVRHKVRGTKVKVSVSAPAAGRISIFGAGLKTVSRSASKAGVYRLEVLLTAKQKKRLRRHKHVELTLHIRFAPRSGHAAATVARVTFTL